MESELEVNIWVNLVQEPDEDPVEIPNGNLVYS